MSIRWLYHLYIDGQAPNPGPAGYVRKTGGHRKEHRDQYTKADDTPELLETDGTNGRNIAKLISSTSHYIFPLIIKSTLHWRAY